MGNKKQPDKKSDDGTRLALVRLATNPCCHPPSCGHARYSECRNALVAAIQKEATKYGSVP